MNHKPITRATGFTSIVLGSVAVVASTLIATAPARAGEHPRWRTWDEDAPRQKVVRFGDLDLSRPEGRRVLQKRLVQAARQVCSLNSVLYVQAREAERQCEAATLRVAMADVAPVIMLASER
jgi:UrcA family protein